MVTLSYGTRFPCVPPEVLFAWSETVNVFPLFYLVLMLDYMHCSTVYYLGFVFWI